MCVWEERRQGSDYGYSALGGGGGVVAFLYGILNELWFS